MTAALRLFSSFLLLVFSGLAFAESEDAMILVAHPAFRDLEYRQTVLLAAPAPNGGHVGVILNRPTRRSLGSLFPEHEPSKKVQEPVFYGGPFSRGALVALVRSDNTPGTGLGAADEQPLPRVPRQHHRPRHRDHAERGALLRRLRRLAAGGAQERDRPGPVVGVERGGGDRLPQGHRGPVGRAAPAVAPHQGGQRAPRLLASSLHKP